MNPKILERSEALRKQFEYLNKVIEDYYIINTCITPKSDYFWGIEEVWVPDIIAEQNQEIRMALMRLYGIDAFLRDGGGKLHLAPNAQDRKKLKDLTKQLDNGIDYESGKIYKLKIDDIEWFALLVENQTVEQGADKLTAEEREHSGLTPLGQKKYVLGLTHGDFDTIYDTVGWTFQVDKYIEEYAPWSVDAVTFLNASPDEQRRIVLEMEKFKKDNPKAVAEFEKMREIQTARFLPKAEKDLIRKKYKLKEIPNELTGISLYRPDTEA